MKDRLFEDALESLVKGLVSSLVSENLAKINEMGMSKILCLG